MVATMLNGMSSAQELTWQKMADMPRPVAGYMAGVVKQQLFIIGGSYWDGPKKNRVNLVQVYDPARNSWSNAAPLPVPRSDAASVTLGKDIYCFGGVAGDTAQTDALVLHRGKWAAVPSATFPAPRLYPVAIASGGYIYVLGGMSTVGDYKTVTDTFWRWRPGMNAWQVLSPLPGPARVYQAMTEIDGNLYVFGGATTGPENVTNLQDAYKYDLATQKWSRLPDLTIANRSWWAVGLGHRALLLAGYTNDFAKIVYTYEPDHELQSIGALPMGLADTKFFRIGDRIVGTGGEVGEGIRSKWTLGARIPQQWLMGVQK